MSTVREHEDAFRAWAENLGTYGRMSKEECTRHLAQDYAPSAVLYGRRNGKDIVEAHGNESIASAVCQLYTSVTQSDGPVVNDVQYDPMTHTWKGSFVPFANAQGNAMGLPRKGLEQDRRSFMIQGYLDDNKKFVPLHDITCFGTCDMN